LLTAPFLIDEVDGRAVKKDAEGIQHAKSLGQKKAWVLEKLHG
jgi:hypothetical protein